MNLTVSDLQVNYKNVAALKGISFDVANRAFITLIGSNGAGKSTTLRAISGLVHPSGGSITLDGQRIDHLPADRLLKMGIAHVPEGRRIFKDLSVLENLHLGAFIYSDQKKINNDLEEIFHHFPILKKGKISKPGHLAEVSSRCFPLAEL